MRHAPNDALRNLKIINTCWLDRERIGLNFRRARVVSIVEERAGRVLSHTPVALPLSGNVDRDGTTELAAPAGQQPTFRGECPAVPSRTTCVDNSRRHRLKCPWRNLLLGLLCRVHRLCSTLSREIRSALCLSLPLLIPPRADAGQCRHCQHPGHR